MELVKDIEYHPGPKRVLTSALEKAAEMRAVCIVYLATNNEVKTSFSEWSNLDLIAMAEILKTELVDRSMGAE